MNPLLQTDSYKLTHAQQYPPGTSKIYSYFESRGGWFKDTVFFGLQPLLADIVEQQAEFRRNPEKHLENAQNFADKHIGKGLFNREGWLHILKDHGCMYPITVKAVPEGTVVGVNNVLMTVENNCPKCFWLTNWLETQLVRVWYPCTVATLSREIKKVIREFLETTGDTAGLDFKLHDFGYRGVSSRESAAMGGAAHLINFKGTDTLAGIELLMEHYDADVCGFSIPAAEHSTITSWGRSREAHAYANMLATYPTGLVAVVSDSYDIYNAISNIWGGELKEKVLSRDGCVVIRPDSGAPHEVVLKTVSLLGDAFGYEYNAKGFKVLCPKVRVIQGDGINYHSIRDILNALKNAGWSADNVAFGMGGGLLQQINRDTQRFAFKCSYIEIDGKGQAVSKQPVTDPGKNSKAGRMVLSPDLGYGFQTITHTDNIVRTDDVLQTVFQNGTVVKRWSLDDVRGRAAL